MLFDLGNLGAGYSDRLLVNFRWIVQILDVALALVLDQREIRRRVEKRSQGLVVDNGRE